MHRRLLALFAVLAISLSIPATAQTVTGAVDRAYLQRILDTWSSFDVEKLDSTTCKVRGICSSTSRR